MMRRVLAALMLCGLGLPARAAPAFPAYPAASGSGATGRWLVSQTALPLASVVQLGPGYVMSFVAPDPPAQGDGLVWKTVREEATSAVMAGRLNGRSATATLAFDCARGQASASNVVIYPGNSLGGDQGRSIPAGDWLAANPGLYLIDLARAACDPRFRRPFAAAPMVTEAGGPGAVSVATDPELPSADASLSRPEAGALHWVQIGAFANDAAARRRWSAIQHTLPEQSAGRNLRTEPAGKTLVRALAGPFRGPAAGQFCDALKARGGDCLVR